MVFPSLISFSGGLYGFFICLCRWLPFTLAVEYTTAVGLQQFTGSGTTALAAPGLASITSKSLAQGIALAPPAYGHNHVELHFGCRNLPAVDLFSESDPLLEVWVRRIDFSTGKEKDYFLGESETYKNSANPEFTTIFKPGYYQFDHVQTYTVSVYDRDQTLLGTKKNLLGKVVFPLSQVIGSSNHVQVYDLTNVAISKKPNSSKPQLIVYAEIVHKESKDTIDLQFQGQLTSRYDKTFIEIYRHSQGDQSGMLKVWMSEVKRGYSKKHEWKKQMFSVHGLSNSDLNRRLVVKMKKYNRNGNHEELGEGTFRLQQLVNSYQNVMSTNPTGHPLGPKVIVHIDLFRSKNLKNIGELLIHVSQYRERHQFMDYVYGGCQINLMVAIDYTESNRDNGLQHRNLHFIDSNPTSYNDYQYALAASAAVLQDYDYDKMFPVFGFGALDKRISTHRQQFYTKLRDPYSTNIPNPYVFPATLQENPYVYGLEGIMAAYKLPFSFLELHNPTYFAPVIQTAIEWSSAVRNTQESQQYQVLLIVTDGIIEDLRETKEAIIAASYLPLSIVIVGVGQTDFTSMRILDGDACRLTVNNKMAVRDIIQFVEFELVKTNHYAIESAILEEIPTQLGSYMEMMHFRPGQSHITIPPAATFAFREVRQIEEEMEALEQRQYNEMVTAINNEQPQHFLPGNALPRNIGALSMLRPYGSLPSQNIHGP